VRLAPDSMGVVLEQSVEQTVRSASSSIPATAKA
jgi:hypothetical protein